jgi:hypothetical protein
VLKFRKTVPFRRAGNEPQFDQEIKEDLEFLRSMMADPAKFEHWANDLLDRAHGRNVERKDRR